MHPRNIYRDGLDFTQIAAEYPPLARYLGGSNNQTINFQDEGALRCLTEALLHRDFKLKIKLSDDRLCPPVPNRLNYVLWIQDLVSASRYMEMNQGTTARGIDIGTGASAIYPLLACTLEPSWEFIVSEIDLLSCTTAQENISTNNLGKRIQLVQSDEHSSTLLPLFLNRDKTFDFTMCNPPFYSSVGDIARSGEAKLQGPNAACTGAQVEMVTSGGEAAFVGKMIGESMETREQCRWYTSMLGKLSSVVEVVDMIKSHSIHNYIITEFVQGQTRRWAVGWSFLDIRIPDTISRIRSPNSTLSHCMPAHNTILQPISSISDESLNDTLLGILSSLNDVRIQQHWKESEEKQKWKREQDRDASDIAAPGAANAAIQTIQAKTRPDLLVLAHRDTWSRGARRREKRQVSEAIITTRPGEGNKQPEQEAAASLPVEIGMACSIRIRGADTNTNVDVNEDGIMDVEEQKEFIVEFEWRKGWDRGLFESFGSHVSRRLVSSPRG
ncbi:hypothetical protein BDP27DRAFT_1417650 [Rhodocollybia butyracea]|uniref:U6 small nuclear RNA (adenine-(43)-N(6))-methyltransferase n=1 Tax=Rhodocollybia butyracea TaxID=206335 RepID=A0A9P5Q1C9_9AGAR|nr:hypothetical protein BDP27DRAFT_1417650 [Rhodocollybia butyracea]